MKNFFMILLPFIVLLLLFGALFNYLKKDESGTKSNYDVIKKDKRTITIPLKFNNYSGYIREGYFQGGKNVNGFDVYAVRWHKHDGFERLVFDISLNDSQYSPVVGYYNIGTEASDSTSIAGELSGYSIFSAYMPNFEASDIIEFMEVSSGDNVDFFFSISLKQLVSYKVFSLPDPARIVIDMKIR